MTLVVEPKNTPKQRIDIVAISRQQYKHLFYKYCAICQKSTEQLTMTAMKKSRQATDRIPELNA